MRAANDNARVAAGTVAWVLVLLSAFALVGYLTRYDAADPEGRAAVLRGP